jgi:hypothetical protein
VIDAGPSLDAAAHVRGRNLAGYLVRTGWEIVNSKFDDVVIARMRTFDKADICFILPLNDNQDDALVRKADALRTIASVENKTIEMVVDSISTLQDSHSNISDRSSHSGAAEEKQTTKFPIERDNFYPELINMIEQSRRSVHFYSISACFGFYSQGLFTFEKMLLTIRHALERRIGGKFIDVKVLVKVDNNPIDVYAAERLLSLERARFHMPGLDYDRNIFREVSEDAHQSQFLIIDDKHIIVSGIENEIFNADLGLIMNQTPRAMRFEQKDDPAEFQRHADFFSHAWATSPPLALEIRPVSRRTLKFLLQKLGDLPNMKSEHELHLLLRGFLQGIFDPAIIAVETRMGETRIDLLFSGGRYGIEVKLRPSNEDIHSIVGQLKHYRREFDGELELLVVQPRYTPQRKLDLLQELGEIRVGLTELG